MACALAGFYLFSYRPQTQKLAEFHDRFELKQRELHDNEIRTINLPEFEQSVRKLQLKLDKFDQRLPRQQELGQFIRDINRLSQQSMLRPFNVEYPAAPQHTELFAELPIQLKFEGDFPSVFSFLRQMEQMQRLTRVRTLEVKVKDGPTGGQVSVDLSMSIYFADSEG